MLQWLVYTLLTVFGKDKRTMFPPCFYGLLYKLNYHRNTSLHSSVNVVTRLRAGCPGKRQKQVIFPSLQSPEQLWGLITPPFIC